MEEGKIKLVQNCVNNTWCGEGGGGGGREGGGILSMCVLLFYDHYMVLASLNTTMCVRVWCRASGRWVSQIIGDNGGREKGEKVHGSNTGRVGDSEGVREQHREGG